MDQIKFIYKIIYLFIKLSVVSFLPAFLDTVKNVVFLQRGKISLTSLDKMALVSAKGKLRI